MASSWLTRIGAVLAFLVAATSAMPQTQDLSTLYEALLTQSRAADFTPLSGPTIVAHTAHPEARSETWTITAHLEDPEGDPIDLQVTLARLGLRSETDHPLDVTALYRGHLLMSDGARPLAEERLSRGLGAAGEDGLFTWIDDWSLGVNALDDVFLTLPTGGREISLLLRTRPAVPQRINGDTPIRGYSLASLPAEAEIDGETFTGIAWFDHLWGDVPLPGGPLTYDRLVVHLDDGSAVSLLRTRRRDGQGIATLDGARIDGAGQATAFTDEVAEMALAADKRLTTWSLTGVGLNLSLATPADLHRPDFTLPFQTASFPVTGTADGKPVTGRATLQLSETAP